MWTNVAVYVKKTYKWYYHTSMLSSKLVDPLLLDDHVVERQGGATSSERGSGLHPQHSIPLLLSRRGSTSSTSLLDKLQWGIYYNPLCNLPIKVIIVLMSTDETTGQYGSSQYKGPWQQVYTRRWCVFGECQRSHHDQLPSSSSPTSSSVTLSN